MKLKMLGAIGAFGLFAQTMILPAIADDTKLFPSLSQNSSPSPAVSAPFSQAQAGTPSTLSVPEIKTVTTTSTSTSASTSTSTSSSSNSSDLRPPQKIEQTVQRSVDITQASSEPPVRVRVDRRLAQKMAKDHWLEKAVAADPSLIDAITQYSSAAKILARHPRIGTIAEADHYTCRRITRWKTASRNLARNPEVKEVIDCDPEGMYRAIKRDSKIGKLLVKQPDFSQIIVDNPDLGKLLATHM